MPDNVVHFAIHADDIERARTFYERVFGWRFEAWGPPGFYRIHTGDAGDPGIEGALHARHEPLTGTGMGGFECTVSVEDVAVVKERVLRHGGEVVLDETEIPTVGTLIGIRDPEGNRLNAMRYLPPRPSPRAGPGP